MLLAAGVRIELKGVLCEMWAAGGVTEALTPGWWIRRLAVRAGH